MEYFSNNKSMCFLSGEELNIILNSLAKWEGPYTLDQLKTLNKTEEDKKNKALNKRDLLVLEIQEILQNRAKDNFLKYF